MRALRYSIRTLARNPAFSGVIVLLLAFGIGANTLIFTAVDVLLLRDVPVDHPERLVRLQDIHPNGFRTYTPTFPVAYQRLLVQRAKTLEDVFYAMGDELAMEVSGHTQSVTSAAVSGNYYSTLGVHPLLGRLIGPDDDRRGISYPVVLSYAFWRRAFNGRSDVIGEKVRLRGIPFTIVGVTPRGFNHLSVEGGPDVAIPGEAVTLWHVTYAAEMFARMRPGVSVAQASAEVESLYPGLIDDTTPEFVDRLGMTEDQKQDYLREEKRLRVIFDPIAHGTSVLLRKQFAVAVKVMMGAVGVLLLLVCANIAGLMLARGEASRKEIAVRLSLGATRFAIAAQLLMDALFLSLLGAAAAMLIARFGGPFMLRFLPARWSLNLELIPNTGVLAFAAGICVITALAMSLVPALHLFRADLTALMGRGGQRQRRSHAGIALIALQVALSTILLTGGGALMKTLHQLRNADPGFDRHNLIVMYVNPKTFLPLKADQKDMQAQIAQIVTLAKGLPGVEGLSITGFPQMRGIGPKMSVQPAGTFIRDSDFLNTTFSSVSTNHFQNTGTHILAGRDFQTSDVNKTKPASAIVTEAFAKRFFPGQDPIGKTFGSGMRITAKGDYQIVGVVHNIRFRSMREESAEIFYTATDKFGAMTLWVRTRIRPPLMIAELTSMLSNIGAGVAPSDIATMEQDIETSLWQERLIAALASVFAIASAVLVAIGLYGMLAYSIARRTREIGIRMALGARPANIIDLISRDVLLSVGPGLILGTAVYAAAARVIAPVLYGVRPMDSLSIAASIALIGIVATIAGLIPARRAVAIEPSEALRQD